VAGTRAVRWGVTIPLQGVPLSEQGPLVSALAASGYTDVWSSEVAGADAFTPLALASTWTGSLRLGTAIVPVFTRGPALIAMSTSTLAAAAPGRFVLGLGASSPTVVSEWNGLPYEAPWHRTRDVLRAVRAALAGERVTADFDTFRIRRFALELPPRPPPPIMLAALRPGMLRLAGAEADGVILNWLAPDDVSQCVAAVENPAAEVVARVFVCPTENTEHARAVGRRLIATYLTVAAYADFHRWLGRGVALDPMWSAWAAGDRAAAATRIPDEVVDALVVHGAPGACRARIHAYREAGVDTPVLALLPTPEVRDAAALSRVLAQLGPGGVNAAA
jgi:probable F420-dependent oxidoreductase